MKAPDVPQCADQLLVTYCESGLILQGRHILGARADPLIFLRLGFKINNVLIKILVVMMPHVKSSCLCPPT